VPAKVPVYAGVIKLSPAPALVASLPFVGPEEKIPIGSVKAEAEEVDDAPNLEAKYGVLVEVVPTSQP
jgi:hypothetical protein